MGRRPPSSDPDTEAVVYNTSFSNHSRQGFVVLKSNWIHSANYIIKNSSERQRLFWRENGGAGNPAGPSRGIYSFFLLFSDIFLWYSSYLFLLFIFVTLTMKPYYPSGRGCFFLVIMFWSLTKRNDLETKARVWMLREWMKNRQYILIRSKYSNSVKASTSLSQHKHWLISIIHSTYTPIVADTQFEVFIWDIYKSIFILRLVLS